MGLFGKSLGSTKFNEFYNKCNSYDGYGCGFYLENASSYMSNVFRSDNDKLYIVCPEVTYLPHRNENEGRNNIEYLLHPKFLESDFYSMLCRPIVKFNSSLDFTFIIFGNEYSLVIKPDLFVENDSAYGVISFDGLDFGAVEIYKNQAMMIRVFNKNFIRTIFTDTYKHVIEVMFYFRPSETLISSGLLYPFWDADYFRAHAGNVKYDDTIINAHKGAIIKAFVSY